MPGEDFLFVSPKDVHALPFESEVRRSKDVTTMSHQSISKDKTIDPATEHILNGHDNLSKSHSWMFFNSQDTSVRIPTAHGRRMVSTICYREILEARLAMNHLHALQQTHVIAASSPSFLKNSASLAANRRRRRGNPRLQSVEYRKYLVDEERVARRREQICMLCEEAMKKCYIRWSEASDRLKDFNMYCSLADRYGPLPLTEFSTVSRPGLHYQRRLSRSSRVVQMWWWIAWGPKRRRQVDASITIQTRWRGLHTRRRWTPIIHLRLRYGYGTCMRRIMAAWILYTEKIRYTKSFLKKHWQSCQIRIFLQWRDYVRLLWRKRNQCVQLQYKRRRVNCQSRSLQAWKAYWERCKRVRVLAIRALKDPAFYLWKEYVHQLKYERKVLVVLKFCQSRARGRSVRNRIKCAAIIVEFMRKSHLHIQGQRMLRKHKAKVVRERALLAVEEQTSDLTMKLVNDEAKRLQRLSQMVTDSDKKVKRRYRVYYRRSLAGFRDRWPQMMRNLKTRLRLRKPSMSSLNELLQKQILHIRAIVTHNFCSKSPPLLYCIVPTCHATFVRDDHYLRHFASIHADKERNRDDEEIAKMHIILMKNDKMLPFRRYVAASDGISPALYILDMIEALNEISFISFDQETKTGGAQYENKAKRVIECPSFHDCLYRITTAVPQEWRESKESRDTLLSYLHPIVLPHLIYHSLSMLIDEPVTQRFLCSNEFENLQRQEDELKAARVRETEYEIYRKLHVDALEFARRLKG